MVNKLPSVAMDAGIYKITNLVNQKVYIGKSKDLQTRLCSHRSLLKHNKHYNIHLQRSYNLYGIENFKFEVIKYLPDDTQLSYWEEYYIKQTSSFDPNKGFNKEKYSNNVRILTQEIRNKMSEKAKNRDGIKSSLKQKRLKRNNNTTGECNITFNSTKATYYINFRYTYNNTKKRLRIYSLKNLKFAIVIRDLFYSYPENILEKMKIVFQSIRHDNTNIFNGNNWYCELPQKSVMTGLM